MNKLTILIARDFYGNRVNVKREINLDIKSDSTITLKLDKIITCDIGIIDFDKGKVPFGGYYADFYSGMLYCALNNRYAGLINKIEKRINLSMSQSIVLINYLENLSKETRRNSCAIRSQLFLTGYAYAEKLRKRHEYYRNIKLTEDANHDKNYGN